MKKEKALTIIEPKNKELVITKPIVITKDFSIKDIVFQTSAQNIFNTMRQDDRHRADYLVSQLSDTCLFNTTNGYWYNYNGKIWEKDRKNIFRAKIIKANEEYKRRADALAYTDSEAAKKWMNEWARSNSYGSINTMTKYLETYMSVTQEQFDVDPYLLNCQNGILNLKTGELLEHDPKHLMTKIAKASFNPEAKASRFKKFLREIFSDNIELIQYIKRVAGTCLTGKMETQALYILFGNGSNGKSKLIISLKEMLGDYTATIPIETIMAGKRGKGNASSDLVDMHGARLVTASESSESRPLGEEAVKALTGGELIKARQIYEHGFEMMPTWTLMVSTNDKPVVQGRNFGIWRRLKLIPFLVRFAGATEDTNLEAKLLKEIDGILLWAFNGLQDYFENGIQEPKTVTDAVADYKNEEDKLADFFNEYCILGPQEWCYFDELFKEYTDYCTNGREAMYSKQKLGLELKERGYGRTMKKNRRVIQGITLKTGKQDRIVK
jgi:putative DNA primase/helicase